MAQAQLDLTSSRPDSNGLEETVCPFHSGDSIPLVIDHLRGAFLCMSCRVSGQFVIQNVAGRRIAVCDVLRTLPFPPALQKQQQELPKLRVVEMLKPRADLDRQPFKAAVDLLGNDQPLYLAANPDYVPGGFLRWLGNHFPLVAFWPLPIEMMRQPDAWAVMGARRAVVSLGAKD